MDRLQLMGLPNFRTSRSRLAGPHEPMPRFVFLFTATLIAAILSILCTGMAASAQADSTAVLTGEALERRVQELSEELRCPTCQAISVRDSEAAFSRQIRDKVRELVQAGQNEEQIKAFFVESYGEWILRAPKKQGVGLILWLLPGAAILFFGLWIGLRVYGNTKRTASAARDAAEVPSGAVPKDESVQPALAASDEARIARDLARFEDGD